MSSISEIKSLCVKRLSELQADTNSRYIKRMERELVDLESWEKHKGVSKASWMISQIGKEGYPVASNKSNSLILFLIGLSSIDPISINQDCVCEMLVTGDCPDIDTDFDPRVREWVKARVVELFGADKTCSIGTYTCYKTRAVIIDVARVLGKDVMEANVVTKRMDPLKAFKDDDSDDEVKVDMLPFDKLCEHYPELKAYFEKNPEIQEYADVLRNQVKNMGMHAGGVIISDLVLQDRIPVLRDQKSRKIISAWAESGNFSELSSVGLVKFDLLGLNNLQVISDCVRLVQETKGITLTRNDIPIDDRDSIFFGSKEDLVGIFQFENPAVKPVVDAVGMESLDDAAAITSLIRPGPKDFGMDMMYARRKQGEPYSMPEILKNMLSKTYGVMVYQEDCMRISRELCGFTGPESNKLRKAIGKKLKDVMAEMKAKFLKGAQSKIDAGEITLEEVEDTWKLIESFAGYGFNRAHAITYSALSCAELWLKWNYPVQFLAALINNTKAGKKKAGSSNMLVDYINYARRHTIEVLSPDINDSKVDFTIDNFVKIRYALAHVRNVAQSAGSIVAHQPYASMEDFFERCVIVPIENPFEYTEDEDEDETVVQPEPEPEVEPEEQSGKKPKIKKPKKPSRKVVESLILAGAFDRFGTRTEMLAKYFALRRKKTDVLPEYSADDFLDKEREMIGLVLSEKPIVQRYDKLITEKHLTRIAELSGKKRTRVFGRIENVRPHVSKAGNSMFIVTFGDDLDTMMFFVFESGKMAFTDIYHPGLMTAMPLKKFEDGDTWFFDVNSNNGEIIQGDQK